MADFLKILFLGIAVMLLAYALGTQNARIEKLEAGPSCRADCVPIQHLLSNRVIKPGVKHSFARPFRTCEEP